MDAAPNDAGTTRCPVADSGVAAWDGAAFAAELADRIVTPAKHASDMLNQASYLTRLFTTISPGEMTEDPEFQTGGQGMPPVSASLTANQVFDCVSNSQVAFSAHQPLRLGRSQSWPRISGMPAAESVVGYDSSSHAVSISNAAASIELAIERWNDSQPRMSFGSSGAGTAACGCSLPAGGRVPPLAVLPSALALFVARRRRRNRKA
jgi:MYXO-CTERM domain-containing protein